ncbi:hypothetical protein Ahy_A08g039817 [Arachis hypogaea]|uniref:Uncharacterized protein n=1 Tax=Arachis hypogaea TaxID=3818 RepID=A0A445BXX4_ARAHY|nr:hypothetical protein Ahy_A08g039817 [Arachis hypogaea]
MGFWGQGIEANHVIIIKSIIRAQEDDEVPKLVHQFYFVKLWPSSEPDSISQIKKQELTVEKMNRDICEITDKIKEKIQKRTMLRLG